MLPVYTNRTLGKTYLCQPMRFVCTFCICVSLDFTPKYSKTCLKSPLKRRPKIGFQARLSFNAGQKYLQNATREQSAILSTFINVPFVFKPFVLSIFEWSLNTGFTVGL